MGLAKEELCKEIGKYDGIVVRSATKVRAADGGRPGDEENYRSLRKYLRQRKNSGL